MKWFNFTAEVKYANREHAQQPKPFVVRAVSCKHALTKATRQHPDAQQHEVFKCLCSETNNDMCTACYRLY